MDNLKSKVVSLELAKRMKELGWKKETLFIWVEIYTHDNWVLAIHLGTRFFIATSDCCLSREISDGEMIDWLDASLFCEVWEELPRHTRLEKEIVNHIEFDLRFYNRENLAEASGELWCWLKENGYIKEE